MKPISETRHAYGLSPKFWQLAHALTGGWEMMNQLLDKEWEVLRDRKFASIWNIGRHKEKLASQLKAIEERIDAEIPGFDPDSEGGNGRWRALLGAATGPSETAELREWKARLAASKKRAFLVNRRLWYWISEQQELSRQLASILSGRSQQQEELTYGADAVMNPSTGRRPDTALSQQVNGKAEGSGFFQGLSQKRAMKAMSAYRKVDSIQERLE